MTDELLEPAVPTPAPTRRRARIVLAALLAAALAGGVAIVNAGGGEPAPLALVAGDEVGALAERAATAPASGDAQTSLVAPDYWGGIEYRVDGELPDLGGKARAWRVTSPDLDQRTAARMAAALGLTGTPEQRDGAFLLEMADGNFSAYPGDGWSISFNRSPGDRSPGSVSAGAAERQVRDLLDRMGVLEGEWRIQTFETQIGMDYACAEDLKLREELAAASGAADPDGVVSMDLPADVPASPPAECPPPPPPVKAHNVAFFPVVGGVRTDWNGWNATVGPEGVEYLYGTWARFEPAGEYKLRSVTDALDELRAGSRAAPMPMPLPADDVRTAVEPSAATAAEPAADAAVPEPQVVTITGVEHSLQAMPVHADGTHRLYLVPAYRFTGTYESGEAWETTVVALHPDAIAQPPPVDDVPVVDGLRTDSGPAVDDAGAGAGSVGAEPAITPDR